MTKFVSVFLFSIFLSSTWAQVVEDVVAVTFFPVYAKAEKMVAVELITSTQYESRYRALEQGVMKNDWRPLLPGSFGHNPGKCTVRTISSQVYDVDCWLASSGSGSGSEQRDRKVVKTPSEVIAVVTAFSKRRTKE